jgi:hypothetical protein
MAGGRSFKSYLWGAADALRPQHDSGDVGGLGDSRSFTDGFALHIDMEGDKNAAVRSRNMLLSLPFTNLALA